MVGYDALVHSHGAQKTGRGSWTAVAFTIQRAEYLLWYLAVNITIEQVVACLRVVENFSDLEGRREP